MIASGVRLSETRVAIRSPGFSPSGELLPTSSTTPVSIPPEPVTGLCILPRLAMISSTAVLIASGSPPLASRSCRNDAASRFSRSTRTRTSSGQMAGSGSSRQAACGSSRRPARSPGAGPAGSSVPISIGSRDQSFPAGGRRARTGGCQSWPGCGDPAGDSPREPADPWLWSGDSIESPAESYIDSSFLRSLPRPPAIVLHSGRSACGGPACGGPACGGSVPATLYTATPYRRLWTRRLMKGQVPR